MIRWRYLTVAIVYTLPNFNLLADIYDPAFPPPIGPSLFNNVPAQLYVNPRDVVSGFSYVCMRVPVGSVTLDFGAIAGPVSWYVECPVGSGKYFAVQWLGKAHEGFPNEYWLIYLFEIDAAQLPNQIDSQALP
jgi:hypothetical protein